MGSPARLQATIGRYKALRRVIAHLRDTRRRLDEKIDICPYPDQLQELERGG